MTPTIPVCLGFSAGTRVRAEIQVTVGVTEGVEDHLPQDLPEGLPVPEPLTAMPPDGLSLLALSMLPTCPAFALRGRLVTVKPHSEPKS